MAQLSGRVLYLGPDAANVPDLASYTSSVEATISVTHVGPLAGVNVLVGANNSGKSRFMRTLITTQQYIIFDKQQAYEAFVQTQQELNILATKVGAGLTFTMTNVRANKDSLYFLSNEHEELHQLHDQSPISIDAYFFKSLSQTILTLATSTSTESFETSLEIVRKQITKIKLGLSVLALPTHTSRWPDSYNGTQTLSYQNTDFPSSLIGKLDEVIKLLQCVEACISSIQPTSKIYVPILRTARALLPDGGETPVTAAQRRELTTLFVNTIATSYKIDPKLVEIQTGLDLYTRINRNRNDSKENRRLFDKFEDFISKNFFQGKGFEVVARYAEPGEQEHLHVSINNKEHEIHFLGDGIQALITLLYPVFLAKPKAWVFIEEPEVHLHPGMQRLFIETLLNDPTIKDKELTIFLTTHSNHLFDTAVENQDKVSVLAFQKTQEDPPRFSISATTSGQLNILNLLEVTNSSVFMANCAIWIEGPSDRIYLRKYLEEYVKHHHPKLRLHEDLEYCFFEYAGSNLAHYVFSDDPEKLSVDETEKINAWFLANRIFLVADADGEKKKKKHSDLLDQQNDRFKYYILPVREIENLLSPALIAEQLPNIFRKWGAEKRKAWADAVRVVPLRMVDYKSKYLGDFLRDKYPSIKFPKMIGEGGTLNSYYKGELAKQIAATATWETMSGYAQELAKEVFNFVVHHNPILAKRIGADKK
jgi:predicted ATP-dependent endonuclease of OLD family